MEYRWHFILKRDSVLDTNNIHTTALKSGRGVVGEGERGAYAEEGGGRRGIYVPTRRTKRDNRTSQRRRISVDYWEQYEAIRTNDREH